MFKLTRVAAVDDSGTKRGTVSLEELIGSPALVEMWQFNYMHDIPWLMQHTCSSAKVRSHFIYGYSEHKYEHIVPLDRDNVHIHGVKLFNRFGTHHSKVMVLFEEERGVKTARVVVHTANLIPFDWTNMTQGAWISPKLPLADTSEAPWNRFQNEFVRYLKAYGLAPVMAMAQNLARYDFSAVTDTLVASVPGNYRDNQWGLIRLKKEVPGTESVVIQTSSIASLPKGYLSVLQDCFRADKLCFVFPTVDNIADSLNGYESGTSIHFKRQSKAQLTQYELLRPMMYQWSALRAHRERAAPHIKTYLGKTGDSVMWFLLTSANMSKQAWGVTNNTKKTFWIQSWECGVLRKGEAGAGLDVDYLSEPATTETDPIFLPYDLPLTRYRQHDIAWSAHDSYDTPDWLGSRWSLF